MKIYVYSFEGKENIGVLSQDQKSLVSFSSLGLSYENMMEFIENHTADELKKIEAKIAEGMEGTPFESVKIAAPIGHPKHDILCVGMNYEAHAKELSRSNDKEYVRPQFPVYFSKRVNKAVDPDGIIPSHEDMTKCLDYECELAVVIGKTCKNVPAEEVYDHIFGYTIVNDITARDIQNNHVQYTFGKGLDDTAPIGPCIVTANEFVYPVHLDLRTTVNEEVRQNSNTKDLIFDIPYMISDISRGITLYPGDIFITGTPAGVGVGFTPRRYLKKGDVVECYVEKIGTLRNIIG